MDSEYTELDAREMKRARKDMFFGSLTEEQWGKANEVQRVILHHIELLVESLHEEQDTLEEFIDKLIEWKEVKQLERY